MPIVWLYKCRKLVFLGMFFLCFWSGLYGVQSLCFLFFSVVMLRYSSVFFLHIIFSVTVFLSILFKFLFLGRLPSLLLAALFIVLEHVYTLQRIYRLPQYHTMFGFTICISFRVTIGFSCMGLVLGVCARREAFTLNACGSCGVLTLGTGTKYFLVEAVFRAG